MNKYIKVGAMVRRDSKNWGKTMTNPIMMNNELIDGSNIHIDHGIVPH